jgi:Golgi apparatus protein 1
MKNLMLIRAKSFDLIPEVQDACYTDLAKFCSDESVDVKGGELRCLQRNLKQLETGCKEAVTKYTSSESKDLRLDQILMKACLPIINELCAEKKDGKGDLLECLIKQKNNANMDEKCRMGIEHHQLLNMEDVNFNPKFRRSCRKEIVEHCSQAKSKLEVIKCLSDIVLNDTLLDQIQRVSDICRSKLRFELLQLNENIKLDPELDEACKEDVAQLCDDVKAGRGEVLECLRSKQSQLSDSCREKLIGRDRHALLDQKADYELQSKCKNSILQYCNVDKNTDLIGCLRKHLLNTDLEQDCRKVVINRIMTQNQDARFNPSLWAACHDDVKKNCKNEFVYVQDTSQILNGRVLKCLKSMFVNDRLSKKCVIEIDQVMREAARVDYRLDPLLVDACLKQIEELCSSESNEKKEDCLRLEFQRGNIQRESKCFGVRYRDYILNRNLFLNTRLSVLLKEVRRIIVEGAADIFIDHELSEICAFDLNRYCNDIPPGRSQRKLKQKSIVNVFCLFI